MTIDNTRLRARWGWTTVLALTVMAVLGGLDAQITAASGYGILDLEFTSAASGVNAIMSAWEQAGMLAQMGFLMGLDYLYMPAYGFSLFYGSLAAREAFAKDGAARRILTVLAFAPLLGAGFDVIENALEAKMLFTGATDPMASLAYASTLVKFALIAIGLALSVAGLAGLLTGRLKKA